MISFLSLPAEIIEQIVSYALTDGTRRAPDLQTFDKKDPGSEYFKACPRMDQNLVWFSELPPKYPPIALVNKHLRAIAAVAQTRLGRLNYNLDLGILYETVLVCTWLSVPRVRTHVDSVAVNVRPEGLVSWDIDHWRSYAGFRGGDGGPPAIVRTLGHLLDSFLGNGPFWTPTESDEPNRPTDWTIDRLVFDFMKSSHYTDEDYGLPLTGHYHQFRTRYEPSRKDNGQRSSVVSPKHLLNFFAHWLRYISCNTDRLWDGVKFHTNVKFVTFKLNGEVQKELNVEKNEMISKAEDNSNVPRLLQF